MSAIDILNGITTNVTNTYDSLTGVQKGAIAGAGALALGAGITAVAVTKRRKSKRKSSKSRNSKRKKGRRTPRTAGKGKDRSRRRIRYTKNGQPYVITGSGKAKFIKKSSAKRSHRQKGGRY